MSIMKLIAAGAFSGAGPPRGHTSRLLPTWTAQQVVEAFPWEDPPKYLLRDRDKICGESFQSRITGMGFEEVLTSGANADIPALAVAWFPKTRQSVITVLDLFRRTPSVPAFRRRAGSMRSPTWKPRSLV
jgi:hypothetical protein